MGADIADEVRDLDLTAREERIYSEVSQGNVPSWLRQLEEVEITGDVNGRERRVTFWVTPDYLMVGADDDAIFVPLSPQTAQRIADLVGGSLPTPRMVDAIWSSAHSRLPPIPIGPGDSMETVAYFERHNRLVWAQRMLFRVDPGTFVAGHKVDVVLTPTLSSNPGKVAVYGWHRRDGRPIQPLFTGHSSRRVLFRNGIRLVDRRVLVDGISRDLVDVLRDPELGRLLSADGPIPEGLYSVQSDGG